ncbi:MAG: MFS transporter [Proteobacteria bacterium]|nr:MFS transporter [Pseudomonadota bacterium]
MALREITVWPRHGLWRHGDFMRLWAAQAISAFGSRISRTALPIVALLVVGALPWEIGILSALAVAPGILVGLLLGGRIDRSAKRPMLVFCDLMRAGLLFTVPIAAWCDVLSMAQLYIVAAGVGACSTLFQIADNTWLPVLIGREHLTEGNAKLEATDAVAEIGGPSAGGILVDLLTAPLAILADAVSYLVSAAFLLSIRVRETLSPLPEVRPTLVSNLVLGLGACWRHDLVRPLFLVAAIEAFFGGFFYGIYMIFLMQTLGLSASAYGILVGLGGIGALGGALAARWVATRLGLGPAMIVLLAGGQALALLIPLAGGPEWRVLGFLGAHQLFSDALIVAFLIHAMSLRQTVLPQAVLGRANASFHVAAGILLPVGAVLAGQIATLDAPRTALWIGVVGGLLAPLVLLLSPIRRLRTMPQAA